MKNNLIRIMAKSRNYSLGKVMFLFYVPEVFFIPVYSCREGNRLVYPIRPKYRVGTGAYLLLYFSHSFISSFKILYT